MTINRPEMDEWIIAAYGKDAGGRLLQAFKQNRSYEERVGAIAEASAGDQRFHEIDPSLSRVETPFLRDRKAKGADEIAQ